MQTGENKLQMTRELLQEIQSRPMSPETEALVHALEKAWDRQEHPPKPVATGKAILCPYCEE
jgi:hypothetical protein